MKTLLPSPLIRYYSYQELTGAVKDGDNPIGGIVEVLVNHERFKQDITDGRDPRAIVELVKQGIAVKPHGAGWLYHCQIPRYNLMLKVATSTRLAEDMSYNPF